MRTASMLARAAAVAAGLGVGACIPPSETYRQPEMPSPVAYRTGLPAEGRSPEPASVASELAWREYYRDDKLRQLIALALENNRDLRIAALNVAKTRAQYRIQRAGQFPEIDAAASYDRTHAGGVTSTTAQVAAGVTAWEVDLFGRLRDLTEQQRELYLASEAGRVSAQVSLIASVAGQYLTVAGDRESLRLARSTLDAQQARYDLIRQSRGTGIGSDLDVSEALSQVKSAQADVANYARQVVADENALALLVGVPVPDDLLPHAFGSDGMMADVSAGLPSDVLLRRPDIIEAEHTLRAAYANIAAARAAFFPKITLTGYAGTASDSLSKLFSAGTGAWQFAPQISLPIFDWGSRKASHDLARVERDTRVAQYQKSIQTAFKEVSNALNARTRLLEQEQAQQENVDALDQTYRLTDARYRVGVDSYKVVLDAQRSLYSGQQALIATRLSRLSNLVTLYEVLGGGAHSSS